MDLDSFSLGAKTVNKMLNVNHNYVAQYIPNDTNRFLHIIGVVQEMKELLNKVDVNVKHRDGLITAAYLHDIGYSNNLKSTGFHPMDGAFHCKSEDLPKPITAAVMFHSCALEDVKVNREELYKTYERILREVDEIDYLYINLVTYCDLHRSPNGEKVSYDERIKEIFNRYGQSHPVSVFMKQNMPKFQQTIDEVHQWMEKNRK